LIALAGVACSNEGVEAERNAAAVGQLDPSAVATFGSGASAPLFQVVGAVLIPGSVVIAEASTGLLHYYDHSGQLQTTVGGKGEGPGEFSRLLWVQALGDHIFAFDLAQFRLSEFDARGALVGEVRFGADERFGLVFPVGVFPDRSILASATRPDLSGGSGRVSRQVFPVLHYGADGAYLDSLGSYEGSETFVQPWGRGGQFRGPLVFGRVSALEVSGARYAVLENNDSGIDVFDASGTKQEELRPARDPERVAVTEADIKHARAYFVRSETPKVRLGPVFENMPIPGTFPFYGWGGMRHLTVMKAATSGDVWVLNFGGVRETTPTWTVYASDGTEKGQITAEAEMDLLDATKDLAVVHRWDESDVETVELRRIHWAQP